MMSERRKECGAKPKSSKKLSNTSQDTESDYIQPDELQENSQSDIQTSNENEASSSAGCSRSHTPNFPNMNNVQDGCMVYKFPNDNVPLSVRSIFQRNTGNKTSGRKGCYTSQDFTYLIAKPCGYVVHNPYTEFATIKSLSMASSKICNGPMPVTQPNHPADPMTLPLQPGRVRLSPNLEIIDKSKKNDDSRRGFRRPGVPKRPQEEEHMCTTCKAMFRNNTDLGQHIYDSHLKAILPFVYRPSSAQTSPTCDYDHGDGESEISSDPDSYDDE